MKRIITILSILTLTISLAGCNPFAKSEDKSSGTTVESSSQQEENTNSSSDQTDEKDDKEQAVEGAEPEDNAVEYNS